MGVYSTQKKGTTVVFQTAWRARSSYYTRYSQQRPITLLTCARRNAAASTRFQSTVVVSTSTILIVATRRMANIATVCGSRLLHRPFFLTAALIRSIRQGHTLTSEAAIRCLAGIWRDRCGYTERGQEF